jgi:predicted DCC family thiol-disulfide oxidoreductase YuxK
MLFSHIYHFALKGMPRSHREFTPLQKIWYSKTILSGKERNSGMEYNETKDIQPNMSIILFDGVCNLCNGAVQFIIRRDPQGHFQFAAQQSDAGEALLKQFHVQAGEAGTIILIEGGQHYTRSTAALRITKRLQGLWPLLYAAIIVPPFLRNAIYDYIARNRYRWFGRKDQCMIPTPEMKRRFLD